MELLIPGLVLVALMVYVSTKIKKNAAKAYETEFIETEEFSLVKPDGFLNPLNDDSAFAFEAFTKGFGAPPHQHLKQATIELTAREGSTLDAVLADIRQNARKIVSERMDDGAVLVEAEYDLDEAVVDAFYKVVEGRGKIWLLRLLVLPEHKREYLGRIEETLESFSLK